MRLLFSALLVFALAALAAAQTDFVPRVSPQASVYQKIGMTDVTLNYCRPAVNDREIWGGLVPYDEIWRTGANEATTLEFSTDVKVNGSEVKAGKYALFTIPGKEEWTVILNSDAAQWGTYNYKQESDVLRFKVKPQQVDKHFERLLFAFLNNTKNTSTVLMAWENLKLTFQIESHTSDVSDKKVRVSPDSRTFQKVGVTGVTVSYGSPAVNDREIWGGLVPYGKLWRTGANSATTVEFSTDVKLNGHNVAAGKYALFTIPQKDKWTVVLNKTHDQWGAYNYKEEDDVLRFEAVPEKNPRHERLVFVFQKLNAGSATLYMEWEDLKLPITIETDHIRLTRAGIDKALADPQLVKNPRTFSAAAQFAADNKVFVKEGIGWAAKAAEMSGHPYHYYLLAKLYAADGDSENARKNIAVSREKGKDQDNFDDLEKSLSELEKSL